MTFSDIFKSSFLNNVTSVSILDMAIAMALAFGVGLFALWLALISPLAYPIVGPYMVAFFSRSAH